MVKEQIIITAFDLFSQYGIKSVSMDDIARNMGISKRTLYAAFEDKETLLAEGLAYLHARHVQLLEELEKGPYCVIDVVLLFFEDLLKHPRWYSKKFYEDLNKFPKAVKVKEAHKEKSAKVFTRLFNRGVKEGLFHQEVNFEILGLLLKDQMKMVTPSKNYSKHSNIEVYYTVFTAFLRGICTEKGRVILDRWVKKKHIAGVEENS